MLPSNSYLFIRTRAELYILQCAVNENSRLAKMRIIKQKNLDIVSQKMELDCDFVISVRLSESEDVFQIFDEMQAVATPQHEYNLNFLVQIPSLSSASSPGSNM